MSKFRKSTTHDRGHAEIKQRKNAYAKRIRASLKDTTRSLSAPVVVGPLLSDPTPLSFGEFLRLPETRDLFGLNTDAATMLGELAKKREFLLVRASKQPKIKAQWRRMLGDYVRRAYLGDARGLLYWRRVSKVIWIAYENLLRLKLWAARTQNGEIDRIATWEARAEKERARQKARRERAKGGRGRSKREKG
jgi:hypothetical protein